MSERGTDTAAFSKTTYVYTQTQEESQLEDKDSHIPRAMDRDAAHRLWEQIITLLSDEREQRVAYLLFHCGLTPADIVRLCPQEFQDVQEVSQLRYAVVRQIQKNLDIL